MSILKKKPKGPTYTGNGDEVTIPFPVKKQDGYYTSMKGVYEDGMKSMQNFKNTNTSEYQTLLSEIMKEEGGTPEQYKKLQDHIAYHESNGTMDPTIKQMGSGPGRGKYQFEEGKDAGGKIAVDRTLNYMKKKNLVVPKWLSDLSMQESIDASKLSDEQQDIIFLGNYKEHPTADFNKVMTGKEQIVDFWGKYHQTKNDELKKKKFIADATRYDKVSKLKKPVREVKVFRKGGLLYK